MTHPFRSAKHKGSVVSRTIFDAATGQDWAGRNFTTVSEILGVDDKGVYKTTRRGKYRAGEPKGGKLTGRLVRKRRGPAWPLELPQLPSYLAYELRSNAPIPVQNAISWIRCKYWSPELNLLSTSEITP